MRNAPCKDCVDRHLGCHSECEKYKVFHEYCNMVNEKRIEAHMADQYQVEKAIKSRQKWRRENKR